MKTIAYCPTMTPYVQKIAEKVPSLILEPLTSAAQVLAQLRQHSFDGAIIGRPAYTSELLPGTGVKQLLEGYTLVYHSKMGVSAAQLKSIDVISYLSAAELEPYAELFRSVTRYDTLEACLKTNLETPVLINLRDFSDRFELLIPMGPTGKDPRFRAPILYHHHFSNEQVEQIQTALL